MAVTARKKNNVDMLGGSLYKNLLIFSMPIAASGFLQLLFNAADLVVVGQWCGSDSLAAVGATSPIANLVVNLFMGLSIGVGVMVSTGLGADDWRKVNTSVHTSIPLALIGGAVVAIVGCLAARPLLEFMSTPVEIIDRSTLYLRIYFCGIPASLIYNYGAAILRADGDTKSPLLYLTISGILNVILNIFFVVVCDLDVAGVALATALTTILSAFLTVRALMRRRNSCRLQLRYIKLRKAESWQIIKIGFPAGMQNAMFSISNIIMQSFVNEYGKTVVAANSASMSIMGFAFVFLDAFSQAAGNFVGQNYGAKQYKRIYRIQRVSMLYQCGFGVILAAILFMFGEPLLGIYIKDNPAAIPYGVLRTRIIGATFILNAVLNTVSYVLRSIGYSFMPMAISIGGICGVRLIFMFTVYQLEQMHNLFVLYLTYPISWAFSFIVVCIAFVVVAKKVLKTKEVLV